MDGADEHIGVRVLEHEACRAGTDEIDDGAVARIEIHDDHPNVWCRSAHGVDDAWRITVTHGRIDEYHARLCASDLTKRIVEVSG